MWLLQTGPFFWYAHGCCNTSTHKKRHLVLGGREGWSRASSPWTSSLSHMPLNSLTQYKQTSDVGDEEEDKGRGGGIGTHFRRGEFHLHGIPRREARLRQWRNNGLQHVQIMKRKDFFCGKRREKTAWAWPEQREGREGPSIASHGLHARHGALIRLQRIYLSKHFCPCFGL